MQFVTFGDSEEDTRLLEDYYNKPISEITPAEIRVYEEIVYSDNMED